VDLTDDPNPFPGGGTIHCRDLTLESGISALRYAARLAEIAAGI
jgi:hypothetical protein